MPQPLLAKLGSVGAALKVTPENLVAECLQEGLSRIRERERAKAEGHPAKSEMEDLAHYDCGGCDHNVYRTRSKEYWIETSGGGMGRRWTRVTEREAIKDWLRGGAPSRWERRLIRLVNRHWES